MTSQLADYVPAPPQRDDWGFGEIAFTGAATADEWLRALDEGAAVFPSVRSVLAGKLWLRGLRSVEDVRAAGVQCVLDAKIPYVGLIRAQRFYERITGEPR